MAELAPSAGWHGMSTTFGANLMISFALIELLKILDECDHAKKFSDDEEIFPQIERDREMAEMELQIIMTNPNWCRAGAVA